MKIGSTQEMMIVTVKVRVTKRQRTKCINHVVFNRITPIGNLISHLLLNQYLTNLHNTAANKQLDDCHMQLVVCLPEFEKPPLHYLQHHHQLRAYLNHPSILTSYKAFFIGHALIEEHHSF